MFFFVREHIFCKCRLVFFTVFDVFYKFRLKYYVFTIGIILSAAERHIQVTEATNGFTFQIINS